MQDLKRHTKQKPATRKFWTSSEAVRKRRTKPVLGTTVRVHQRPRDPTTTSSKFRNIFNFKNPDILRNRTQWILKKTVGISGFLFAVWLIGGSIWVSQDFFLQPLKQVRIHGNYMLSQAEVLSASGLQPGQLLFNLDPYVIAENLQKHAVIQKADIRRIFPNSIYLTLHEYQAVAQLQITVAEHVLIDQEQRLLKRIPISDIQDSPYKNLPLIKGVEVGRLKLGVRLHSPVLERGLQFIKTFQEMTQPNKKGETETDNILDAPFGVAERASMPVQIDVSDPLNLKMSWPLNLPQQQVSMSKSNHGNPLIVQMGNRDFSQRIERFYAIYPVLDKQHPGLRSIDLRYANKVMLVP